MKVGQHIFVVTDRFNVLRLSVSTAKDVPGNDGIQEITTVIDMPSFEISDDSSKYLYYEKHFRKMCCYSGRANALVHLTYNDALVSVKNAILDEVETKESAITILRQAYDNLSDSVKW
jgi:hypothetical protein